MRKRKAKLFLHVDSYLSIYLHVTRSIVTRKERGNRQQQWIWGEGHEWLRRTWKREKIALMKISEGQNENIRPIFVSNMNINHNGWNWSFAYFSCPSASRYVGTNTHSGALIKDAPKTSTKFNNLYVFFKINTGHNCNVMHRRKNTIIQRMF